MSRRNGPRNQAAKLSDGGHGIERLIEKQSFKDAYKQAKLRFRQDASPENRRLVERVSLLRIQQLVRSGSSEVGKEVAENLLEFGVTDAGLLPELVVILPQVGLAAAAIPLMARLDSAEVRAVLTSKLADLAVTHPDQTPTSMAELREGAQRIHAALTAIDENDQARAVELLKDIPRRSPWADWRYFARGWAAMRRGEPVQALADWERLDPGRMANSIANTLRRAAAASSGQLADEPRDEVDLSRLEVAVFGEPLLKRLNRLAEMAGLVPSKEADWDRAIGVLRVLSPALRRVDPRFAQRLTALLLEPLRREMLDLDFESAELLAHRFIASAEPLAWDPQWNRFWALVLAKAGDLNRAGDRWERYADDLENNTSLTPAERRRLSALVWRRIAEIRADRVDAGPPFGRWRSPTGQDEFKRSAMAALEHSLRFDPTQRDTHQMRIELGRKWGQAADVRAAAERLLETFPEDVETLRALIELHIGQDEPEAALGCIERFKALKPLDGGCMKHEFWAWSALARRRALEGRCDEGREALAQAARIEDRSRDFRFVARQAALEFRAGRNDAAERLVDLAMRLVDEPAAVWLSLAIEGARYEIQPRRLDEIQGSFRAALKKTRATGRAAGLMAESMRDCKNQGLVYRELEDHVRAVKAYIISAKRAAFTPEDLVSVCEFLRLVTGSEPLLRTYLRRGLWKFPKHAIFPYLDAMRELSNGPFRRAFDRALRMLTKAMRLAQASSAPADRELVENIKRQLALLGDSLGMAARIGPQDQPSDFAEALDPAEDDEDQDWDGPL